MPLVEPNIIKLTEDVPDAFRGEVIPIDTVGEILVREWVNGRQVWFVEFVVTTSVGSEVTMHADVFPDQAIMFNPEG